MMTLEQLRDTATEHDADRAFDNAMAAADEWDRWEALREAAELCGDGIRALLAAGIGGLTMRRELDAWHGTLSLMSGADDVPGDAVGLLRWCDRIAAGEPLDWVA